MLILGPEWKKHRVWAYGVLLATALALILYVLTLNRLSRWPTGSHPLNFSFGVIGALLIFFEALLWLRKKLRLWRIFGSPRSWMIAHIWLGLFTIPMVFLHSGFYLGGPLTICLMVVYLLVIISGVVGLWLQQIIPQTLFHQVPHETIYSQIDRIVFFIRHDAERLIQTVHTDFEFARIEDDPLKKEKESIEDIKNDFVRNGAPRGGLSIVTNVKTMGAPTFTRQLITKEHPIISFSEEKLSDFLSVKSYHQSALAQKRTMTEEFDILRRKTDQTHIQLVDDLQSLCVQRQNLILQKKLHWVLYVWLFVHSPLTIFLLGALGLHIVYGLWFW